MTFSVIRLTARHRLRLILYSVSWLLIAALIYAGEATALELVRNGSFEAGAGLPGGGPRLEGWDDGPALGNNIGYSDSPYPFIEFGEGGAAFEVPPGAVERQFTGLVRPRGAGLVYGAQWGIGNGTGRFGSATQILDLGPRAGRPFVFSAWLASRTLDTDYAIVELNFFSEPNTTGDIVDSAVFDGSDQSSPFIVGSLNLEGFSDASIPATQDNWTFYRTTGSIPSAARSAAVVIRGAEVTTGGGNHGYVDLVSLRVIPEPSSLVLLLMGVAAGMICYRRRRVS